MSLKTRLTQHFALAAVATVAVSSANAQIVHSGIVNIEIPATTNGLYLNVVTGASNLPAGGTGSTVPGWDINPWGASGFGLFSPGNPTGGAYVITAPSTAANMAFGDLIGAANTYGSNTSSGTAAATAQWNLNSDQNLVGFRFFNEANSQIHYGWARFSFGSTVVNRTLVEYAFDATPGASIGAGVVPAPSAMALLGLGGLVAGRRRR
ncbi:MAG: PEP-CTERM sorting domain-containing protein [Phycisphaerales bacterium]|nr:PEP-CTERM sorting domain-containing protein [Planctomycetota bacterium]MCH8509348.1 PEP-CTERM sorting domain-containing protein [Phycisphaerales bacterium]